MSNHNGDSRINPHDLAAARPMSPASSVTRCRTRPGHHRLIRNDRDQTVTDTKTGEVIPLERLDEYAQAQLDAAVEKLARACGVARYRIQAPPETVQ